MLASPLHLDALNPWNKNHWGWFDQEDPGSLPTLDSHSARLPTRLDPIRAVDDPQVKCTEPCKEGRTSPWDWEMHGTRLDSDVRRTTLAARLGANGHSTPLGCRGKCFAVV